MFVLYMSAFPHSVSKLYVMIPLFYWDISFASDLAPSMVYLCSPFIFIIFMERFAYYLQISDIESDFKWDLGSIHLSHLPICDFSISEAAVEFL